MALHAGLMIFSLCFGCSLGICVQYNYLCMGIVTG